jgi:hypothetical protein
MHQDRFGVPADSQRRDGVSFAPKAMKTRLSVGPWPLEPLDDADVAVSPRRLWPGEAAARVLASQLRLQPSAGRKYRSFRADVRNACKGSRSFDVLPPTRQSRLCPVKQGQIGASPASPSRVSLPVLARIRAVAARVVANPLTLSLVSP